jgi:mono/diheme cytochrome c family protein
MPAPPFTMRTSEGRHEVLDGGGNISDDGPVKEATSMNGFPAFVLLAALLLTGASTPPGTSPQEKPEAKRMAVGQKLAGAFSLRDVRGNRRSLSSFREPAPWVLAFLGKDCPVSNLYVPRLAELEKRHRARVRFAAVYPNENETLDDIAAHALERDLPFLVLKDFGRRLADAIGVERTPEVALLDGDLVLRYRGRIDDQYGVAYRKEKPERAELAQAIDELLAGRPVAAPETEADGCLISRQSTLPKMAHAVYTRDVAPILQKRCQACHRPGQIGPFPLVTYEDAADHAAMIREVVVQRRMPPWHADPRYGSWTNNRSLSREEIAAIAGWVEAGAPRGEAADAPAPVRWPEDWSIGKPDAIFTLPREQEVPAQGTMDYLYFVVPTGFAEDRWVQKAEVRPGDARVVHHVLVYVKLPGREVYGIDGSTTALVGWAPGDLPLVCPPGVAVRIPKEASLQFEVHYTPNGKATRDRTSVGIVFAAEPPARESRMNIFARIGIRIPPRVPHHREEGTMTLREDVRLVSAMPHAHLRGKSWRYEAIFPDGKTETLLLVPRWDFNWQSVYRFDPPLPLPKGTRIRMTAHFDNSEYNPANPDPAKEIRYGLQTWEEMMNGWIQYVPEKADR